MLLAIILAVLICLVLLFIVYKHMPRKSIFALFCILLASLLGLTAYLFKAPEPAPVTTEYQQEMAQQQIDFDSWYTRLKKAIHHIDYIWQQYHNAIDCYNEKTVDLETTHQQLVKLEGDSQRVLNDLKLLTPPENLDEKAMTITVKLLNKVQSYTEAQLTAIHLSALATDKKAQAADSGAFVDKGAAADKEATAGREDTANGVQPQNGPEAQESKQHKALSQRLNLIMLTESPEGLFIADEITAIRQFFKLPEEQ